MLRPLGLFLAIGLGLSAKAAELPRGKLLGTVAAMATPDQTYALYVPTAYDSARAWPVVFCFDPGARGRVPVERLQAAAERFGWIVAGSNNSRNGPWAANAAAITAMMTDVTTHLRVASKRIYTAGLSGGARVATQLAISGLAKGVIACSAGFPISEEGIPAKLAFGFFGTTGTEDFNYSELRRVDGELDDRKAPHRLVVFPGGHEWAPEAVFIEALAWHELQAMKAGTRARDDAMIKALWETRLAAVPAQPANDRYSALKSLAADFNGLVDVAAQDQEAKKLGAQRDVKDAIKAETALFAREDELAAKLADTAVGGSAVRKQKLAEDLLQRAGVAEDTAERRMVRRVIAGFASSVREGTTTMLASGEFVDAAGLLEMAVALRPGQARTLYELARARAFGGEKAKALDALRQAAAAGFSDAARVESEPAFAKLKGDAAFQAQLAGIRANPAEPAPPSGARP